MAVTASEVQSLNEIEYKSKLKIILKIFLVLLIFVLAFLNFFPISDKIKAFMKSGLQGRACNPDFEQVRMEWIMPKIIVTGLKLPAGCFDRAGDPVEFNHVTLNWHLISFAPFGLPFRLDTELYGQPVTAYIVQGFNQRMVRIKDQSLVLSRLQPLLGDKFKLNGSVTVDLNMSLTKDMLNSLALKVQSKDLQIPPQNIQGFTTPPMKLNEFYLEANSANPPRINVDKLILGDTDSPIRANFKGKIELQERNIAFSPMDLTGEVAFSQSFSQALPLIDMVFSAFTQKDGFYQIRLGGTLGAPKPSAP